MLISARYFQCCDIACSFFLLKKKCSICRPKQSTSSRNHVKFIIRILRGMTQKYLGTIVGFPERSADVRLAQYETGTRKPKAELTAALAQALDVSPHALDVPDIDSYIGLMHTLFTLEDLYGLTVSESDGEICLKVDTSKGKDAHELRKMLYAWKEQADKLSSEEISKDKYDEWRYHYPEFDTTQIWPRVPSQELSDVLTEAFKNHLKDD